jgi:hypothetical protein
MKSTEVSKIDSISSLISELKEIHKKPEIQLQEYRVRVLFRKYIFTVLDSYGFDLGIDHTTHTTSRTYTAEDMKKIWGTFKKTRDSIEKEFSNFCRDFDLSIDSLFRRNHILTKTKKSTTLPEIKLPEIKAKNTQWQSENDSVGLKELKRFIYTCRNLNSPIKQIQLWQRQDDISIQLGVPGKNFEPMMQFLRENGYPTYSTIFCLCSIVIPDLSYMEGFLEILTLIEDSISEIQSELVLTMESYLSSSVSEAFPGWLKGGNLNDTFSLNNTVRYLNRRADASVQIISLLRSAVDDRIFINLKLSEKSYEEFLSMASKDNYPMIGAEKITHTFSIHFSGLKKLECFLKIVALFDKSVSQTLTEDIIKASYPGYCSSFKMSFLMGLHSKIGKKSAVGSLKSDETKVIPLVFSYL